MQLQSGFKVREESLNQEIPDTQLPLLAGLAMLIYASTRTKEALEVGTWLDCSGALIRASAAVTESATWSMLVGGLGSQDPSVSKRDCNLKVFLA